MRLSGTVMEVLPGRLFQVQRSVVGQSVLNITLISYTPLRYIKNVAREELKVCYKDCCQPSNKNICLVVNWLQVALLSR